MVCAQSAPARILLPATQPLGFALQLSAAMGQFLQGAVRLFQLPGTCPQLPPVATLHAADGCVGPVGACSL